MNPLAERLLYCEPRSGVRITYGQLFCELTTQPVQFSSSFQPKNNGDALKGIVKALLLDRPLDIYDGDFSDLELESLGATKSKLLGAETLPPLTLPSIEIMVKSIGKGAKFRLGLFTSGSTGIPKKVSHTFEGLARGLRTGDHHLDDIWALAYNPTHIAGVQVILQAFANSNTIVDVLGANRSQILSALCQFGITHISATPTFYRLLLPLVEPLASVRAVTLGGERAGAELLASLRECFPSARVRTTYASTEAGTLFVSEEDGFKIPERYQPLIRIRDSRLEVHHSLLGETSARTTNDGWYDTGDVVEVLCEAPLRFRVLARDREWVNIGGSKVNPAEVEEVLSQLHGVRHVRVYGMRNSVLGQILCADVVTARAMSNGEIRVHAAAKLQPFKVPRVIRFVDAIQQTRSGKVKRL